MHIRTAAAAAVIATVVLTGCAGTDTAPKATATATPSATQPGKPAAASSAPTLTDEQRASIAAAIGLPPTPQAADWAAYIKALDAIDTDIVHGKEDKAVSRGIDSCSGYKRYPGDTAKQIKFTGQRFSSPTHPEGRDTATATKILTVAHKYICPTF